MAKNYLKVAEEASTFLNSTTSAEKTIIKGERHGTIPLRSAREIEIDRIKPDSDQPRKLFTKEKIESLAASIKEVGGIIDPLTVEYDDKTDLFVIISGERRYRASKLLGLKKLPCLVKEVEGRKRFLMQVIANLQREDITPVEEAACFKQLQEKYGFSQIELTKLLNKSKSYICQMMGLNRFSKQAKEIVQTSELSKEIQIQASKEKDPEKQLKILESAIRKNKTVRQVREDQKKKIHNGNQHKSEDALLDQNPSNTEKTTFLEWNWNSSDNTYIVTVKFKNEQSISHKNELIQGCLKKALSKLEV